MKTQVKYFLIENGCGGNKKGTKCAYTLTLPYGKPQTVVPSQVTDNIAKPKEK